MLLSISDMKFFLLRLLIPLAALACLPLVPALAAEGLLDPGWHLFQVGPQEGSALVD